MTKRKTAAPAPGDAGNARSAEDPGQSHPWTDEEMAAAKPLPLPTVGATEWAGVAGVPHAGKGQTQAGGRPENDEA